jgi:hypothetical protein
LFEKLHIGTGSIDWFRVVELLRMGVLGFGYGRHAQGNDNSLSLTPWNELP